MPGLVPGIHVSLSQSPARGWPGQARPCRRRLVSRCAVLQLLVALAPVTTAFLNPFQAAGGVGWLVSFPLVGAGVQAALMCGLLCIFRIDRAGEYRGTCRRRGSR